MSLMPIIMTSNGVLISGSGGGTVSNLKNVRELTAGSTLISAGLDYRGFGFMINKDSDTVTHFFRAGTGHLTGGKIYRQNYTVSTDTWGSEILVVSNANNLQDCAGGLMDNGQTIVFCCEHDGTPRVNIKTFYVRLDSSYSQVGGQIDVIGGTSSITALANHLNWCFGPLVYLGTGGAYSQAIIQYDTTGGANKVGIIKTTDYFATFSYHQIDLVSSQSETTHAYLGSNRMIALVRPDLGGSWSAYYSSDLGETWTPRGIIRMGHWNEAVKIMQVFMHNGLLDILYQDRDSGFITISRGNVPDDIFDNVTHFQPSELIYYNFHPSSTYNGLGYPWMVPIVTTGTWVYFLIWCKETFWVSDGGAGGSATLMYTRDDLVTDPLGIAPTAPVLDNTLLTSTGINITIRNPFTTPTGYTDAELQNIKYFLFDVSTASDFSTFVTAKWMNDEVSSVLQNKRLIGPRLILRSLLSSTTYYIRIKAANNTGQSSYTTITLTTSAP